jgi:hypothetical protein
VTRVQTHPGVLAHSLVNRFVYAVNSAPRRRIREEDIPLALRQGGAAFGLYYSWTIQSHKSIHWIEPLEHQLGVRLPPVYRSLVTRFVFPSFEFGSLILLANTGQPLYNELSTAIVRDRILSQTLLKNGYAQFARPCSGDYDPVCFDFNRISESGECPVVRIDHERILLKSVAEISEEMAPSFADMLERFISLPRPRRSNAPVPG